MAQHKYRSYLQRGLWPALFIGLLVVAGGREGKSQAARPHTPVQVVNAASEAVPTRAQGTTTVEGIVGIAGTPTVNVGNAPTVRAQQEGAWNVGLAGTPSVNLAAGSQVGIASSANTVQVGNTVPVTGTVSLAPGTSVGLASGANTVRVGNPLSSPVLFRNVNDAVEPIRAMRGGGAGVEPTVSITTAPYVVPVGKRLVIESISVAVTLAEDQKPFRVQLATFQGSGEIASFVHMLPVELQGVRRDFGAPTAEFVGSESLRLYADAGEVVRFQAFRETSTTGTFVMFGTISGYLSSAP